MNKTTREKPIEQAPAERAKNFGEVSLGFDAERAAREAKRCLNCKNAGCKKGCPVNVDIPSFIAKINEGDIDGALKVIKGDSNLPSICGRVCPQEIQCESMCIRNKIDAPVAIGLLERFVADHGKESTAPATPKNGKKVAVVGSGPAGLTCAGDLAKDGFEVTVFEAFHKGGGVLTYGIPEFRLPKTLVQKEIEGLERLGVHFEYNVVIGKTLLVEELTDSFDAVFIGSGAGLPMFMNIPGENANGVYSANEYLTRINLMKAYSPDSDTPILHGKNVVVVGAGNVAMDSARTALRMGGKVSLVYRRGRDEMPARNEEIEHAVEEGVELKLLTNPVRFNEEGGWVKSATLQKMELGEPDASGRRRPVPVEGSEYDVECDMVVMALGTSPNPLIRNSCKALETSKKGTLVVDENEMTSVDGVYAGGDAVTGAATVILAMGAGKRAAEAIAKRFA